MAINFPASPSNGDRFVTSGTTYMYDGEKWTGITEVDAPGITPANLSSVNNPVNGRFISSLNDMNFQFSQIVVVEPDSNGDPVASDFVNGAVFVGQYEA